MKIAYLTSAYARAGDTFIRAEVSELRRRGHEVHTFSIRRAAEEDISETIREEQAKTDYILERGLLKLAKSFGGQLRRRPARAAEALTLAVRIRPPGLVAFGKQLVYVLEASYLAERLEALGVEHLHNHIPEGSGTVTLLASMLSGVPYSQTVHGPGFFFHVKDWALGEKVARSAFFACITSFCKSQCMIFTPVEHWPKLAEVRCGLDSHFLDAPAVPPPEAPRLVMVGRLCPEKGFMLMVEAVKALADEGVRCEVDVIGGGPLAADLERRVRELGLADRIHLLGWKSSDEVREHVQKARALLLPSFAEGLPVVIMEALALGRPVISTHIAGIPELVRSGETGWLVPAGSTEPLVEAMREAVTAPLERIEAMGAAGRILVRERHDITVEVGKLESLMRGRDRG